MTKTPHLPHDLQGMERSSHIVIIGTGAVGSWLASEILRQDKPVAFVDRDSTPRSREWTVESAGIARTHRARVDTGTLQSANTIIVTTRAHHLEAVWQELLADLSGSVERKVVVCCNGLIEGTLDQWRARRPDILFYLGIVTAGVTERDPGHFVRSDRSGTCYYGALDNSGPADLPPVFIWDAKIRERARRKWLFNTAANTLAGALKLSRNDLMITTFRNHLRDLFDESYDLACELWPDWRQDEARNPARRETLWLELCQLIADTGGNENSMSRAARLGKGTGEARFLGGVAFGHSGYPELKRMTRRLLG